MKLNKNILRDVILGRCYDGDRFDMTKITTDPYILRYICEWFWDHCEKNFSHVGGMAPNAAPLVYGMPLCHEIPPRHEVSPLLIHRDKIFGHPTEGAHVLCLADQVISGGYLIRAIKTFREAGLKCNQAFTILDCENMALGTLVGEGVVLRSIFKMNDFGLAEDADDEPSIITESYAENDENVMPDLRYLDQDK